MAVTLALLLTGCGSGVETTIGKAQTVPTALPGPTKRTNPTNFPAIRTRFVLPHLDKDQKPPVQVYVRWSAAYLQSLYSGKLDPEVKKLSSAKAFKTVRSQTARSEQNGGVVWDTIVERIHSVTFGSLGAAITACLVMTGIDGSHSKQSLLTVVSSRDAGWYVLQTAPLTPKLPNC